GRCGTMVGSDPGPLGSRWPWRRRSGRRCRVVVPTTNGELLERALGQVGTPFLLVERAGRLDLVEADPDAYAPGGMGRVAAFLPAIRPESLGDPSFRDEHGLRFAYVSGAMANGIGSVEIALAMGRAGMLGIFGAAGLSIRKVEAAIDRLE